MPTVSIIMPFKNAEAWIEETIQSVIGQTFEAWELIAIDDYSSDNSRALVNKMCLIDTRISCVQNDNQGIIPALQKALSLSKGDLITRMDADDLMPKNRLASMVKEISRFPPDHVITGKVKYISSEPISKGYEKYEEWLNTRCNNNDFYDHIYRECVVASPNWLARKKLLLETNIFDKLKYPEDYDLVFHWFRNDVKIKGIDEVTLLWREHPRRTSRNSSVYDQQSFFELKTNWFLQLNDLSNKSIGIIGAGVKGKLVASIFKKNGVDYTWYDKNSSKYQGILDVRQIDDSIALICVYPDDRTELSNFLISKGYVIGKNAWFF